jgi:uncharacterized FlaG/YvyC family protein
MNIDNVEKAYELKQKVDEIEEFLDRGTGYMKVEYSSKKGSFDERFISVVLYDKDVQNEIKDILSKYLSNLKKQIIDL